VSGLIVVAVDPATGSPEALKWAAGEARFRDARVHAVMAWRPARPPAAPAARPPLTPSLSPADPQADAEARLARMVDDALGTGNDATRAAVHGSALQVLLRASRNADLLVVDPPRLADLTRAKASLLTPQLVFRVPCPVVVIPPRAA
jgi:nucleotide-binding universal stress UspA family protein